MYEFINIYIYMYIKDFLRKDITYTKSCNSNLYTKYPSATYIGLLLRTMCCLQCKFVSNYTLLKC